MYGGRSMRGGWGYGMSRGVSGGRGGPPANTPPSFGVEQAEPSRKRPLSPQAQPQAPTTSQASEHVSCDFSDERTFSLDTEFGAEEAPAPKRERREEDNTGEATAAVKEKEGGASKEEESPAKKLERRVRSGTQQLADYTYNPSHF